MNTILRFHFTLFSIVLLGIVLTFSACATYPKMTYQSQNEPIAPDYSKSEHWAALPQKEDMADVTPTPEIKNLQSEAEVDVFFLHPTTYFGKNKMPNNWNGFVDNTNLNEKTDDTTIKYQASIFNGAGRVFAPRYRQANYYAYSALSSEYQADAKKAFELAYGDLKRAFEYYLENYNEGRPIVIAAHSQGSTHGKLLVKEFFDGTELQDKLVVAYLVGMSITKDYFENIKPCETEEETGCFCAWRTYQKDYFPKSYTKNNNIAVTNPLTWTTDDTYAPKTLNQGGVLTDFNKVLENLADAQIYDGLLWANKPKFPGSILFTRKNYHVADFNFYYMNVRENVQKRIHNFKK